MASSSKNILITGGAGYLGSVLAPMLLGAGYSVTVLDNLLFGQTALLDCCHNKNFSFVRGDCREERVVGPLAAKADVIIPLAALVGAPLCNQDKLAATSTNRDAVDLLCRLASKDQQILIPTTNSGYGIGEKGKLCTEESPLRPLSLYGTTKCEAENLVLSRENGLSFRFATLFGTSPRMRLDLLVNDFVYRAVNDRAVVIFEGHFKRNYLHVRDAANAFLHAIANFDKMRGRAYNAGLEDANLSKLELCTEIQKQLPHFVFLEAPIGEDPDKRDYIVSNARLLESGFRPHFDLSQGITELIKAYQIIRNSRFSNV